MALYSVTLLLEVPVIPFLPVPVAQLVQPDKPHIVAPASLVNLAWHINVLNNKAEVA